MGRTATRSHQGPLRTMLQSAARFPAKQNEPGPAAGSGPGRVPAMARPPELGAYFDGGEEEGYFVSGCFERVRTMDGICLDRLGEILADRSRSGVRRVGCSHYLPVESDRVFSFEHLNDNRTRGHEVHEASIEWALGVNFVKALSLSLGEPKPFLCHDAQPSPFQAVVDRTGKVAPRRVGFDDRQRPFDGHHRSRKKPRVISSAGASRNRAIGGVGGSLRSRLFLPARTGLLPISQV